MKTEMRSLTVTPTPRRTNPSPPATLGRLARARRAAAEITPETIERIAQRVVQLLHHQAQPSADAAGTPPRELMDADQLAKHLGLTRAWVYEHAQQLGAIRLGDGPRPRLRFDPQTATQALDTRRRPTEPAHATPRPGRPRRRRTPASVSLLPVHEPRNRGIFARWQRARTRRR